MSAIPGVMKLYVHRCGCISSERFADGTVFVLQNCDGDLVFDRIELSEDPARETTFEEATEVIQVIQRAIKDAKNLHSLQEALRSVVREF